MGCFNLKGCVSNIAIEYGDEVVLMLGLYRPKAECFYVCDNVIPISLPIYGKYNDYGGLEGIVKDDNVEWIEEHLGKLEDVIEAFDECQDRFSSTIEKCLNSDNDYHPRKQVRYVYENLLKLSPHIEKTDGLCLLFEHKDLFKKWQAKVDASSKLEAMLNKVENSVDGYKANHENDEFGAKFFEHEIMRNEINRFFAFIGDNNLYEILALYPLKTNYYWSWQKDIKTLYRFLLYLHNNGLCLNVPMQYSQQDYYIDQLKYHNDCIKFLKDKIKKHKERYEE